MTDFAMWVIGIGVTILLAIPSAAVYIVNRVSKTTANDTIQKKDIDELKKTSHETSANIRSILIKAEDLNVAMVRIDTDLRNMKEREDKQDAIIEQIRSDVIRVQMKISNEDR